MTHKESAVRRKKMVAEVEAGASLGETALKYDVEMTTVRKACYTAGCLEVGTARQKTVDLIATMLNTNDTLSQIAKRLNMDLTNVARIYRRCVAAGIKLKARKRGRPVCNHIKS